ncbi:hypothetical protein [Chryseobacterium sp. MMS23-Vi53]|uniref:hypothetical protein n=1 Tax=Chryseobacterium sp. MMS23-Vi53 TaxID=3386644 RepID=UPI0039ED454B
MKNLLRLSMFCMILISFSCTKEKTINDELKEAAASMNKSTPQILSDGVRLDSVTTQPNKTLKYNYTLTEDVKESVTPEEIETFKNQAKEGATKTMKTSADMEEFRNNNVSLKYSYYDKNGKPIAEFIVTPEDYKSK